MSKSKKKPPVQDNVKENEAPAHRSRREAQRKIEKYVGRIHEWDDEDEELQRFEPIKRKAK